MSVTLEISLPLLIVLVIAGLVYVYRDIKSMYKCYKEKRDAKNI